MKSDFQAWKKPILVALGVGTEIGVVTIAAAFYRRRLLDRVEMVNDGDQVSVVCVD